MTMVQLFYFFFLAMVSTPALASVSMASTFADSAVNFAVDGLPRCEKWEKGTWFDRSIGRANKPEMNWPYPLLE